MGEVEVTGRATWLDIGRIDPIPLTLRIATDEHAYGDLSITAGDEATTRNLMILACENEQRRKPDQRIERTRERLGNAYVALIHEKPIEDVTVQDVLERASVGRSTFYLHFRDKNDLLLSQLEKFLEMMSTSLSMRRKSRIELCL
jgi:Bacterial regulatory proteins, tetR family